MNEWQTEVMKGGGKKAYRQTSGDSKNIHTDWAVIGEKLGMDGRTDKSNESRPVDKVSRSDKYRQTDGRQTDGQVGRQIDRRC